LRWQSSLNGFRGLVSSTVLARPNLSKERIDDQQKDHKYVAPVTLKNETTTKSVTVK
jgi:hypothetical protein